MFCPNCALQNSDESGFCRSCGTNLSAVRHALTVKLPETGYDEMEMSSGSCWNGKPPKRPSMEKAISEIFVGLAFLAVSICVMFYAPAGRLWWFWMLIPAFGSFGKGVAQLMAWARVDSKHAEALPPASFRQFPERDASNTLRPPASVTEGTTRTLNMPRDRGDR
jgi:zinc-ribbon domain